jgi:hypothetical protein
VPQLYEDDARIGHQEFDLKLTNRVKMCMVREQRRWIFSPSSVFTSCRWEFQRCPSLYGPREYYYNNVGVAHERLFKGNFLLKVRFCGYSKRMTLLFFSHFRLQSWSCWTIGNCPWCGDAYGCPESGTKRERQSSNSGKDCSTVSLPLISPELRLIYNFLYQRTQ